MRRLQPFLLFACLVIPQVAFAHGLHAEAHLEGDEILLTVTFSGGGAPTGADVTVSVEGADIATGKTDANGVFRYRPVSYGTHVFSVVELGLHHARASVQYLPINATSVAQPDSATLTAAPDEHDPHEHEPHDHDSDRPGDPIGAVPWSRIGLGLLVIVGLALLLRALQAKAKPPWLGEHDDRARIVTLGLVLCGAGAVSTLSGSLVALVLALAAALSLGMGPRTLARRLWPLLALLVPLFLLTPFWHRPPASVPLVASWSWGPTDVGLLEAARIAARVLALGLLAIAALDAAPFDRTIKALQDLRVPRALTHTALLTYRYLFLLRGDLRRVRYALSSRGFRARPTIATANTFGAITGGLLVRSLARTERVEHAMRCRGYTGELRMSTPHAAGGADALLVVTALAVAVALVLVDQSGLGLP